MANPLLGQFAVWWKRVCPDRRHYTRLTTSNNFIPEIDGLRFVAILAVIISHFPTTLLKHNARTYDVSSLERGIIGGMSFGGYGVQLFFLISGFILALPFARHHLGEAAPVGIGKYLLRRVTRLEPPYLINLLLCAGLLWMSGKYDLTTILQHTTASLGYSHNWIYEDHSIINRVAWSLEIEVQFYLLAPLLTLVFKLPQKIRRFILLCCIVSGSLLTKIIPAEPELLIHQIHYFLAGFLLVDLYLANSLQRSVPQIAKLAAVLVGLAYFCPSSLGRAVILPWAMLALGLAGFCSPPLRAWLVRPWICIVGGMCYTIYLYHGAIISGVVQTVFRRPEFTGSVLGDTLLLALIALPLIAIVSMAAFRLIERPCMRPNWPSELWSWLRKRSGASHSAQALPDQATEHQIIDLRARPVGP